MGNEQYRPDIEADALRFYGWWVELEDLVLPDVRSARLLEMLERLPYYGGALTMALQQEVAQQQGAASGPIAPAQPVPGLPVPKDRGQIDYVDSSPAALSLHPAMAGLFDFAKA